MRGFCLCGQVEFEIDGHDFKLYQCHCSLCRRQGGAMSNAATIVAVSRFRWIAGLDLVSSWRRESGFRSDFCSTCGSPVPNPLRDLPYVWIPAGLLDDGGRREIVAHFHTASKAAWDPAVAGAACYDGLPDLSDILAILQADGKS
jgi:hypothetical protein